ncbi:TPR-like protein [Fistulina hepatica ATCC 64428]|uniref:TPR-like protein n=1 Tax=Fistulina hepatica ATCC 64428 TaxID=1128425 RepID=A0A0D7A6W0_9AGAR|nr:TPR-like protein [Fistulina hepatica ATCC 64428]
MDVILPLHPELAADLRRTRQELSDRCLFSAATWAAELLLSLPPSRRRNSARPSLIPFVSTPENTQCHDSHLQQNILERESHLQEFDDLTTARAHMSCRDFDFVIKLLGSCKSPQAHFLYIYARFISSELSLQRDWFKSKFNKRKSMIPNNNAVIQTLLCLVEGFPSDPYLLFLEGLLLSRLSRREEALEKCILSITAAPLNWAAWSLLGSCINDAEELSAIIPLLPFPPGHFLVQMLQLQTLIDLQTPGENELGVCERLLEQGFFPNSLWIMGLRACTFYHLHDLVQASVQFERIRKIDPSRIDHIDLLSHCLFVADKSIELSQLAHEFLAINQECPEVCCLVANHYSHRADHEKAIKYFRRATQLDDTCIEAWTLMGHEFIEIKNSHAAIHAYRKAIEINRKEYRAWYGLGQAYELLTNHYYALHYYHYATALRPYDVRLWQGLGCCYEVLGRLREALECFKRAQIPQGPNETIILAKLADLHRSLDEVADSVACHRRIVELHQADNRPISHYAKSALEVAQYEMDHPEGDLLLAREYLTVVAGSNAIEVTRAAEMLKALKARDEAAETLAEMATSALVVQN